MAVCLLFSFLKPEHEQLIAEKLRAAGFSVSISSEILPEYREYERASTTAVNAYVSPVLERYLSHLEQDLPPETRLRVMQSNGGNISPAEARAQRRALHPLRAGGRRGGLRVCWAIPALWRHACPALGDEGGHRLRHGRHIHGCLAHRRHAADHHRSDHRRLPDPHPRAGHPHHRRGRRLDRARGPRRRAARGTRERRRGPRSGLLRQRRACPPSPTPTWCWGASRRNISWAGRCRSTRDAPSKLLTRLGDELDLDRRSRPPWVWCRSPTPTWSARCASSRVERGHDPRDFTLLSFGGAGGLHAADLARGLGIPRVLVPPLACTLSAFGMLAADVVKDYTQTVMLPGDTPLSTLEELFAPLAATRSARGGSRGRGSGPHPRRALPRHALSWPILRVDRPFQRTAGLRFPRPAQIDVWLCPRGCAVRDRQPARPRRWPAPTRQNCVRSPWRAKTHPQRFSRRGRSCSKTASMQLPSIAPKRCARAIVIAGPAVVVRADTTVLLGPADSARVDGFGNLLDRGGTHDLRPHPPGDLQAPLRCHRRGDGHRAAQGQLLPQHQGAARFLLRRVRRARAHDRPGGAHPGAPGLDAALGRGGGAAFRGRPASRRCDRAERPLPRRHPPAGHHHGLAGVRDPRRGERMRRPYGDLSPPAPTTPTWAG